MRTTARFATALAVFLALAAVSPARSDSLPEPVRAPGFPCKLWLNSKPLTISDLRGKVVLVDFWEYTCINCIRTFPYLRRWNELYGPAGLVIVGVHTPEFDFAKSPALVADAVKRFRFTFPIAVDSKRTVWDAFHNDAWPADYLIDANGNIVFTHVGEGDYAGMELRIQTLLKQAHPTLDFTQTKYHIPPDRPEFGGVCRPATPETYLGFARGDRIANAGGYQVLRAATYTHSAALPVDSYALGGTWIATPEYIKHASADGKAASASLALHYRAKSLYLVAGSDDSAGAPLFVEQDGHALAPGARGVDVKQDANGRTFVELGKKRMYYLVNNPEFGEHQLQLTAARPGIALYSFTFGNNCETAFEHR
jgi:thiol-disulfide isomerase/thioredoxin